MVTSGVGALLWTLCLLMALKLGGAGFGDREDKQSILSDIQDQITKLQARAAKLKEDSETKEGGASGVRAKSLTNATGAAGASETKEEKAKVRN
jgi:hypothetical protein